MTDYGSPLFAGLRAERSAEWEAYTHHPFVTGLGDGTLPKGKFLAYLRQDYVFLIHFARAWAMAVVKSDRVDEMRQAAATVHALIDPEMHLHIAVCAEEGISAQDLAATEEAPSTLAYTRFVSDAGISGDLLDLLVALTPCVMGYGEIGRRLAETSDPATPYRPWIETYAGDDYQSVCTSVATLLERVAQRKIGDQWRDAPRWPELSRSFGLACRLESEFWTLGE